VVDFCVSTGFHALRLFAQYKNWPGWSRFDENSVPRDSAMRSRLCSVNAVHDSRPQVVSTRIWIGRNFVHDLGQKLFLKCTII